MTETISINDLSIENENLKKALRTVFERQKKSSADLDFIKNENEKLNATLRKQATTIPELQIQNRVLQQQLKNIINDLHISEKKQEGLSEKNKQIKQKLLSSSRRMLFTRVIVFLTFLAMTGLIWQSYRENESNKKTLISLKKVADENETLVAQNKAYFEERESFQTNINKKYKDQLNQLQNQLTITTNEKIEIHTKLTQAIENFNHQKADLHREHLAIINLTKNNYENQLKELAEEKKSLKNQLAESEIKSREIVIENPVIKEPKHNNFMKAIQTETKEKSNKSPMQNVPSNAETKNEPDTLPSEEPKSDLDLNKTTPFKFKTAPF